MPHNQIGSRIEVTGYFTEQHFIAGSNLKEMEKRLGFKPGMLAKGCSIVALLSKPGADQFEYRGYTYRRPDTPLNIDKSKYQNMAKLRVETIDRWSIHGPNRLLKIIPTLFIPNHFQIGSGITQWELRKGEQVPGKVIAVLNSYPSDVYHTIR